MPVYDLYSKRQKRLRGDVPDVYTYDVFPQELKVQIIHIWKDSLVGYNDFENKRFALIELYKLIADTLKREYGLLFLNDQDQFSEHIEGLISFFIEENDIDRTLDIVELSFQVIEKHTRNYSLHGEKVFSRLADTAINELNQRFKEHGVGYEFIDSEIIRKDSELIHSEVVKPALKLLNTKEYRGAQEEFLDAFNHYKKGKTKEAMNEALKAFESTMKSICDKRNWTYDPDKSTSSTLIDICYKNGLIPKFWQDHMKALRKLLESGVPTGRNKMSGHGQGATPKEVPDYIASYILHMTASAIVFLVNAERDIK